MQFFTGGSQAVRSFSAIACSIPRVFRKTVFRDFTTVELPIFGNVGFCRLFKFLVKASQDTTLGRCRHLRRAPIPHRRLIQEQHFRVRAKLSKSEVLSQRRRRKHSGILTDPRPHRTQGQNKPRGQTPPSDHVLRPPMQDRHHQYCCRPTLSLPYTQQS